MKNYALPAGYNFLQSLVRTYKQVKNPIGTMEESMEKFDGTYTVDLGTRRLIATQDPGFIDYVLRTNHKNYHKSPIQTEELGRFLGKGLLTVNGDYWLKQRRLIQPGFHLDKIHALYAIIKKTVDDFLASLPTGRIDVYPYMHKLAFEIVINSLFNIKVPQETRDQLSDFINEVQAFVIKDLRQPYKSWWFKLSGEVEKNLQRSGNARVIIRDIINTRKQSGQKFNDLLDMLLDARYEDTGEPMHEDQVIDEILIVLIAGHETTANALSWTLYLLANHKTEMTKLKAATQGLTVNEATTNDALAAVIKESMRLYPPAWISDRMALTDDAYNGFTYPKGIVIILFYYGLHRDARYWPEPDSFIPERFAKENDDKRKPKAFYPFGGGPRLCIGNNFAMAEMAIFLQTMIHSFEIDPTEIHPKPNPLVTLRPDRVMLEIKKA
ncbi:MAG TPA: cytochrome P450 [Cyclobacteriaceae bacterium]|nr:cytochrome P450 [Cyclobacteriaceae bacterium]HMV07795.1 cytochrome P450 [Cyclobacteriaceae bacterium]HMV88063.1 cytochrome P450 [Cyclobacteriaceae bacterium]HMW98930.1 cytochrome P450 [Cyclobacteriaceae bacterium]HMX48437.1 cytochrome P450 [Cyclobacteriaceae bacterium]